MMHIPVLPLFETTALHSVMLNRHYVVNYVKNNNKIVKNI